MNEALLDLINGPAGNSSILDSLARFAAEDLLFVLCGLLALAGCWEIAHRRQRAIEIGAIALVATAVAIAIAFALGMAWFEARPFVADADTVRLIPHGADASFPSDHAAVAAAVATVGALAWRRFGPIFIAMAVIIGIARVYVGVHYPLDIVAGWAIGASTALGAWAAWAVARGRAPAWLHLRLLERA